MIQQLRDIVPAINFDFGLSEKTISAGSDVIVWLDSIYNQDAYSFGISAVGSSEINIISNYQYTITYDTPGTYEITVNVSIKGKSSKTSNTLTITVE